MSGTTVVTTMRVVAVLVLVQCMVYGGGDQAPTCQANDFHYEFTECDEEGGRWRVSVPEPGLCVGGAPNAPVRVNDCSTSCEAGKFFNLSALECESCPSGTSSLGGGLIFDSWETLPPGFHVQVESFRSSFTSLGRQLAQVNCTKFGWQARGEFLVSPGGPCASVLLYTVKLVKPGALSYSYQYSDESVIFNFQVQNEQCQSIEEAESFKWPPPTEEGKWRVQTVQLRTGINVLQWKTIGVDAHRAKPVLIRRIEVSGVAYASSCTPCRPGTYSQGGSRLCSDCPKDTSSGPRSPDCRPCPTDTHFAPAGSPNCLRRPPCNVNDYYEMHSQCDANNQTQLMYKWAEPRTCREDDPSSVPLPPSGQKQSCPPCNPGMQYGTTGCEFCPRDHYSDGVRSCQKCPPSTTPNYGYQYQWWSELPPSMSSTCMSVEGDGCTSTDGWQPAGDHIHSMRGHSDAAYLVLSLNVAGFRGREGLVDGRALEVGRVSFAFQLQCQRDCEFVFMQGSPNKGVTVIHSWTGSQEYQRFSYVVTENDSYTFSWAFQKYQLDTGASVLSPGIGPGAAMDSDVAKIFVVNVTNTVEGGASACLPCPQGAEAGEAGGCVTCPPGQFIDPNTTACSKCPPHTVSLSGSGSVLPYGEDACKACGPGLTSWDGQTCTTDCRFNLDSSVYDLRALAGPRQIKGSLLFTASGTQYFHLFNISLCGMHMSQCANNVSYQVEGEASVVKALVCRSTVVPAQTMDGGSPLSTQAVSLGDHLVGVTPETTLLGMAVIEEFARDPQPHDLHFFFTTPAATRACPQGRDTTITLRCNPASPGNGTIRPPSRCPDATCDGCNFHFLWESALACPRCGPGDYRIVRGECVDGKQDIHYLPTTHCIAEDDEQQEGGSHSAPCTTKLPFLVQVMIAVSVAIAGLLCGLLLCFWKQHRRLEYKYMKLVQSAGPVRAKPGGGMEADDGDVELPPAESCALQEGEEDEQDMLQYSQPRGHSLFNKIKAMTGKSESGNPFEIIRLTEKDALS